MKKTILATCKSSGAKIVSRHCFPHVVENMTEIVDSEAKAITGTDNYEITVTDKIEF